MVERRTFAEPLCDKVTSRAVQRLLKVQVGGTEGCDPKKNQHHTVTRFALPLSFVCCPFRTLLTRTIVVSSFPPARSTFSSSFKLPPFSTCKAFRQTASTDPPTLSSSLSLLLLHSSPLSTRPSTFSSVRNIFRSIQTTSSTSTSS